jgi:hypothetical protein
MTINWDSRNTSAVKAAPQVDTEPVYNAMGIASRLAFQHAVVANFYQNQNLTLRLNAVAWIRQVKQNEFDRVFAFLRFSLLLEYDEGY